MIDCGGPCTPCATCYDGIQNQEETGIDCGGGVCLACPTCSDGIKNQNETDIDCGGPCMQCEIMYPPAGKWGSSILRHDTIIIVSTTGPPGSQTSFYTLRAELPESTSLKVIMRNTTVGSNAVWYYYPAGVEGWGIDTYDYVSQVQSFHATGKTSCDVQVYFTGEGSATLEIYENQATTPARIKKIKW